MVFPDEKDQEDEVGGIETRSGKRLSAAAACECSPIQSTSNATMLHTLDALAKWKQSTLCFHACLKNRCDPLRKFLMYSRQHTCRRCKIVRKLLQNELILVYDKEELETTLLNYLYFHALKVFDANADQHYAKSQPQHPYFSAYSQFRDLKRVLTTNIVACFNVPIPLQTAALRPFIFRTKLRTKWEMQQIGGRSCELCTEFDQFGQQLQRRATVMVNKLSFSAVLVTISGRRYLRSNFQFATDNPFDDNEPQQFLLCSFHFRFFDCFYQLTHMDWNVHLNLRHRVTQLLAQNPEMNAEQLINGIEPTVFSNLFNTYMQIIQILNVNYEHLNQFSGKLEWIRFILALKNEAIFKKVTGMANGL
ncbi:hypothetical protein niasHT_038697 [Heterodera trifolii]|uniref:Uncharacterized protein n=1 Tax=Heterodera trifolii TaxID=157864 RepID=A0ABD2I672_9BILA